MKTSSQGLGAQSKLFCRLHELRGDLWLWVSSSSSLPPSLSISTSQRFNYFLFTPMKLCPIVSQVRLQTTAKSGDPVLGQPRHSGRRTWAAWGTCWGEARGEFSSTLRELYCLNLYSAQKELVPFTQLVKVRGGNLVWALPSIRFSWNFYQIISGTKYE